MSTVSSKAKSFVASASKTIGYWLEHHPVVSNSILCLNLWIAGDLVAQYSEHKLIANAHSKDEQSGPTVTPSTKTPSFFVDQYDWIRTAQCASYGATVTGPILAVWYPYLDKICNSRLKLPLRYGPWAAPIAKVAADEFLMDPPCLVLFFGYMNVCEGGSWETFREKLRAQFFPSWYTSLLVWPGVLLGTFRFLPVPYQAPVINACCIVWDAFLSHRNALANHEHNQSEELQHQRARSYQ